MKKKLRLSPLGITILLVTDGIAMVANGERLIFWFFIVQSVIKQSILHGFSHREELVRPII